MAGKDADLGKVRWDTRTLLESMYAETYITLSGHDLSFWQNHLMVGETTGKVGIHPTNSTLSEGWSPI